MPFSEFFGEELSTTEFLRKINASLGRRSTFMDAPKRVEPVAPLADVSVLDIPTEEADEDIFGEKPELDTPELQVGQTFITIDDENEMPEEIGGEDENGEEYAEPTSEGV
jgi:hypothetical protein